MKLKKEKEEEERKEKEKDGEIHDCFHQEINAILDETVGEEMIEEYLLITITNYKYNYNFHPLTIITKRSILDVAAVLDPPLRTAG